MRAESNPVENLPKAKADPDEPPPVLGTWGRFYAVVVANTLVVYLLLFLFSYFFRP
jgi:hypothetical protein